MPSQVIDSIFFRDLYGSAAMRAVFDEDLHNEPRFTAPVTRWLTNLFADGAAKTVAKAIVRR